jgi:glycosyltransferase involved in cell wall biosynthesis
LACLDVIIPVRNDESGLLRCLESIDRARRVDGVEIGVVVADNGSRDRSPDVARERGAKVLDLPGLKVAALRNRAVAELSGEWIAFIDADHEIAPGWFEAAVEAMGDAEVAGAGAHYHPPEPPTWVQRIYNGLRPHSEVKGQAAWLGSGNLVVRRSDFERVGGFDETLETCEDVDLCMRLTSGGRGLLHVPAMRSIHYGDPATLRALFRSELWRGRDNLRVTFRHGFGLRDLPSVGMPVAMIVLVVALVVLVAGGPVWGWWWALLPLLGMALVVLLRTALLTIRTRTANPLELMRLVAVAATYEAARAGSLVRRTAHRRA